MQRFQRNSFLLAFFIGLALTASAQAASSGWQELLNTHLQDVCPPNHFNFSTGPGNPPGVLPATLNGITQMDFNFNALCYNVMANANGASADTQRNRMIIWGGGHAGSSGNEVYSLNLMDNPPTMTRLNDPSIFDVYLSSAEVYPSDGSPPPRHTFGGQVYLPVTDELFAWEGASVEGAGLRHTWRLNLATMQWRDMHPELTPGSYDVTQVLGSIAGAFCAYDPNSQGVICEDGPGLRLFFYDTVANKWIRLGDPNKNICQGFTYQGVNSCNSAVSGTTVVDPVRKIFFQVGTSNMYSQGTPIIWATDISPAALASPATMSVQDWTPLTTGCEGIAPPQPSSPANSSGGASPGVAYDSALDKIVIYPNDGNTVFLFDPVTKTCTTQTFPNGPPPGDLITPNGTFGRFEYFPALDAFSFVSKTVNDAFLLRLNAGAPVPIAVAISPSNVTLTVATGMNFTAAVTGNTGGNTTVTWSVQEAGGGTIDQSGNYAAPTTPGTYHVVATSQADVTKSSAAVVTVNMITALNHPRLPHPDAAYLSSLAGNATVLAKYNAAATTWDSTNPPSPMGQFRWLLLAYMASKAAGTPNMTYFNKIEQLANLNGTWGHLLLSVNDGVGNNTYTLTSASANFLTGCGGASCQNQDLNVSGLLYNVDSVVNANTVVLRNSNPAPNGSNLPIRIFLSNSEQGYVGLRIAMIYDWLYADLDAPTKTAFLNQLENYATQWEAYYTGLNASPYNDQMYVEQSPDGLIAALTLYPDFDQANPTGGTCRTKPCGTYHMNWMTGTWFNVLMPVWQQIFGPDGGGWHESWSDYVNSGTGPGLTRWLVPSLLSWQSATGDPIFQRLPWLKNFAYWTMYETRPDFTMEHIGEVSGGTLTSEYHLNFGAGAGLGSLNGLAEIYNDPALRGWARIVNQEYPAGPDGFEPSAWPFYTPDKNTNSATGRAALPTSRNFPGWGVVFARSGWGEDDTDVSLKYGDNFWSHTHADAGTFTISHRGNLAINSGSYRTGSNSEHEIQYGRQTISQNSLLIVDPNDVYPTQSFPQIYPPTSNTTISMPLVNDGGQRRVGTFYNQLYGAAMHSPSSLSDWQSSYDYYHTGTLKAYGAKTAYTYASVDITPAYNNKFSAGTPNSTNRTNRAASVIRNLLFIQPGYVVIFDEVNATNPSFIKKWLLHSVNAPTISGNRYEIDRTENVSDKLSWTQYYQNQLKHVAGGANAQYQYDGKLVGWMVYPQGSITPVGGPGKEFWIADPKNPATGSNWNQCQLGQCSGSTWGWLANGGTPDFLSPNPSYGPIEPGSWRLEETPGTPANQDYFLNVMLATNFEDTNVPATVTGLSDATSIGATWSDANNTYTVRFSTSGVGGHITITGAVNVDEDLPGGVALPPAPPQTLPTAPTGFTAKADRGAATLTWNTVFNAASYNLYWMSGGGDPKTAGAKAIGVNSPYTLLGLINGTTYTVVVTAANGVGESPESQVTVTPSSSAGPPPGNLPPLQVTFGSLPITDVLSVANASAFAGYGINWTFTPITALNASSWVTASVAGTIAAKGAAVQPLSAGLSMGTYQVSVTVVDGSGNVAASASGQITFVSANLSGVRVYPNPWRSDKHAAHPTITFDGVTLGTTIKIFTVSGHEAKELHTDGPKVLWDLTNDSGDKVASGVYLYVIMDSQGDKVRGKIGVIK